MRSYPEQELQRQIAEVLTWTVLPPATWTAHPLGGGGELRGQILKGMGTRAGWPDLEFLYESRFYGIEIKPPSKAKRSTRDPRSKVQKDTHALINAAGCPVVVCTSVDEALTALAGWGIPLRPSKPVSPIIRALAAELTVEN